MKYSAEAKRTEAEVEALSDLVADFSNHMKAVLFNKTETKTGWDDPESYSDDDIIEHINEWSSRILAADEGDINPEDLVDLANYAAFLWNRVAS